MSGGAQVEDLGILLGVGYQAFVERLRAHLAERGFDDLGRSDGFVFRALADRPMTISSLASLLRISKQGAAQIVDDMQRRGYVERRPDPTDGRARLVHLAPRGRDALAAARRFHRRYETELVRQLGAAAVATLRTVLTAMAGDDEHAAGTRRVYL